MISGILSNTNHVYQLQLQYLYIVAHFVGKSYLEIFFYFINSAKARILCIHA